MGVWDSVGARLVRESSEQLRELLGVCGVDGLRPVGTHGELWGVSGKGGGRHPQELSQAAVALLHLVLPSGSSQRLILS